MTKSIALFDIDNTIYQGFSYFELLKKQVGEGIIAGATLERALACMAKYKTDEVDYETTIVELLDIYAASLKGTLYKDVLRSTKEFYRESDKFFAYVRPTMELLRGSHDIALVTGEPQFVAEAVAELYSADSYHSSSYEVHEGVFTGKVVGYLALRHEKLGAVRHLLEGHAVKGSFAFGDSEGDIEMLSAAERAICLNPTEGLQKIAAERGWHTLAVGEVEEKVRQLLQKQR